MNLKSKTLHKTVIIIILVISLFLLRSELILKILLLLSSLLIILIVYPYASLRMMTLRQKLFGHLFRYQNRSLSMTGQKLDTMADSLRVLSESFLYSSVVEIPESTQILEEASDKLSQICDTCGRKQLTESREMIAEQILGLSSAVHGCAKMLCSREEVTELQKQVVASYLHSEGIRVREIAMFHDNTSGRELVICAKCRRGSCITVRVLAERLSVLLEIPLVSSEENRNVIHREYQEYIFYEMPRFYVLTGAARLIREGGTLSGDNYSFVRTGRKNSVMVLADGMGSGFTAGKDSTLVVELLEQLLEAGFEETAAVRMLNTAMVLRSEQVQFTTLDLCVLNLYTGNCEFVKAGAATTFIKRKNWVEAITSTSIPLGFLGRAECEMKHKKLYHDDYVIMVSDGAIDCIGLNEREEYLENLIADLREPSPQEMANSILQGIVHSPGYYARDDITVLVSGLYETEARGICKRK